MSYNYINTVDYITRAKNNDKEVITIAHKAPTGKFLP